MRIVAAIDSFKGSISSVEAGEAVRRAARKVWPDGEILVFPVADGGEGTVDALCTGLGGETITVVVTGPLGDPVEAVYGILPDGTAVMEMAAAAGITLVPKERRDPMYTTTFGVGQMITDALDRGCRRFLMGIGGSATNDGGTGMLAALGFRFLDADGNPIALNAAGLENLNAIDADAADPRLREAVFRVACDVNNPLCGEHGCSAVFGPQKGASPEDIIKMDRWLQRFATLSGGDPAYPGSGAAGGLGFAFLSYLHGSLEPGVEIVLSETGLENAIREADLVVTGEGRLDSQTVMGKAPIGVARLAKKHGKPVIAFSGCVTRDAVVCNEHGIDAFFPVVRGAVSLEEAMDPRNAKQNLYDTAEQVFRLMWIAKKTCGRCEK